MRTPQPNAKLEAIRRYVSTDQRAASKPCMKMAKLGAVIDTLDGADRRSPSAPCSAGPRSKSIFGVVPCTVMSMMSENLMSSACEVDICGVVGMHALQLASETPSALLDWNNNYGEDPDKAVCFHCSNLPKHFFKDVKMDFQQIIAGTVGRENTYGTCVGLRESRPDEFRALLDQRREGKIDGYVGEGEFTDDPLTTFGGAGVVRHPQSAGLAALHLRARLRAPRGRQPGARGARRARSHHAVPGLERRLSRVGGSQPASGTCAAVGDRRRSLARAAGRSTASFRLPHCKELLMSIVAGVDFGTLSVRVSIFDSARGKSGRRRGRVPAAPQEGRPRPRHAKPRRSHAALAEAMRRAIDDAGIDGRAIEAIALDTTGSSVIPVDAHLEPIDDYYLWCDHRAWKEAGEITAAAHARNLEAIDWCGGIYSSRMGLRQTAALAAPQSRKARALRHRPGTLRYGGRRPLRHHRPRRGIRAASAPWATSGCGTARSAACLPRIS